MTKNRRLPIPATTLPAPAVDIDTSTLYLSQASSFTKVAVVLKAPVSGVIDLFEFAGFVASAQASTRIKISFRNVDANDLPDGTADQYRILNPNDANEGWSVEWVTPGLMTSDGTDNGTKRTVTRGDKFAVVWEFNTMNLLDVINFGVLPNDSYVFHRNNHSLLQYQSGAWVALDVYYPFAGTLKYDPVTIHNYDGVGNETEDLGQALTNATWKYFYQPECFPVNNFASFVFNNTSDPDERGVRFYFQSDVRLGGCSFKLFKGTPDPVTADIVLYDSQANVLDTVSLTIPSENELVGSVLFTQDHKIAANEIYRITVKATSANDIYMRYVTFGIDTNLLGELTQYRDAYNSSAWNICSRTDSGTFIDDVDTTLPVFSLFLRSVEQDGNSGGWFGDP